MVTKEDAMDDGEPSRYVRRSAHLPRGDGPGPDAGTATVVHRPAPEETVAPSAPPSPPAPTEPQIAIDLTAAPTRYERHSGNLPHLTETAGWRLERSDLPRPVAERGRRRS